MTPRVHRARDGAASTETTRRRRKRYLNVFATTVALLFAVPMLGIARAPSGPCETPPELIGTWEWGLSIGGFTGDMLWSPATAGYTQIEFEEEGWVRYFRDERLEEEGPFEFLLYDGRCRLATDVPIGCGSLLVDVGSDDVLTMWDHCADGFRHVYVRRPPVDDTPIDPVSWSRLKGLFRDLHPR